MNCLLILNQVHQNYYYQAAVPDCPERPFFIFKNIHLLTQPFTLLRRVMGIDYKQ
jgi:hypothetical protein